MKPLLFQHQFLRNLLTIQFINIHFNTRFSTALSPFNEATFVSTPRFAQLFMSTLINIKPYTIDKHCHTPDHTPGNAPILQPVSTSFHFDMFSIIRAYQYIYVITISPTSPCRRRSNNKCWIDYNCFTSPLSQGPESRQNAQIPPSSKKSLLLFQLSRLRLRSLLTCQQPFRLRKHIRTGHPHRAENRTQCLCLRAKDKGP